MQNVIIEAAFSLKEKMSKFTAVNGSRKTTKHIWHMKYE